MFFEKFKKTNNRFLVFLGLGIAICCSVFFIGKFFLTPEIVFGTATTWNQNHYRIYKDIGPWGGATALAAQDASPTTSSISTYDNLRIRFEIANTGTTAGSLSRKLQFSVGGSNWTTVTTSTTGARFCSYQTNDDGDPSGASLLTATGDYYTDGLGKWLTSTTTTSSSFASGYLEDEWCVNLTDTLNTYWFRVINADGDALLNTYTVYPKLRAGGAVIGVPTQTNFRVYSDTGAWGAGTALAAENTNPTVIVPSTNYRLRIETAVSSTTTPASSKTVTRVLQFSGDGGTTWAKLRADNTNNVRLCPSNGNTNGDPSGGSLLTAHGPYNTSGQGKWSTNITTTSTGMGKSYLEDEYCIYFLPGAAGTTYRFRITDNSSPFGVDTYPILTPGYFSYWVGGSGNWSEAATHWASSSGGAPDAANLPTSTNTVVFDSSSCGSACNITIDSPVSITGILDTNSNRYVNIDTTSNPLSVSATTTISGTFTAGAGNTFKNLTINSGATFNDSSGANIPISGDFSNSGTFTAGAGTVTFSGTTSIGGNSTTSFNNLTISSGTLTAGTSFNIGGNFVNNATFTESSGTATFNGTSTISGSGAPTFSALIITGTVNAATTINTTGVFTVNSPGVFNAGGETLNIGGNISGTGTFNGGSGTANLTKTSGNQSWALSGFNNVVFTGTTNLLLTSNVTITGNFTNNSNNNFNGVNRTFTVGGLTTISGTSSYSAGTGLQTLSGGLTLGSGTTLTEAAGTVIKVGGNTSISSGSTFTKNASANLIFNSGNDTQTLASGGKNLGKVQISSNTTNTTLTLTSPLLADSLTVDANNTFSMAGNVLSFSASASVTNNGTVVMTAGEGTLTNVAGFGTAAGLVKYSGGSGGNIKNLPMYSLAIDSSGNTLTLPANTSLNGTLTVTAGTFSANTKTLAIAGLTTINGGTYLPSTSAQTLTGGLTFSSGTITESTGIITIKGDTTVSNGVTFTKDASGKVVFASGDANQDLTSGGIDIGNIQISSGAGNTTLTLGDSLNVDNITIDASQTLSAGAGNNTIFCGGNWANSGTFTANSGTVTFDAGSGTQTLTPNSSNFKNLSHTGASILSLSSGITATGTLLNSNGTFNTNTKTVTVGDLATVSGGTYTASTGQQTFNGGLTINGSGIFSAASGLIDVNGNLVVSSGTLTAPVSLTDTAFTVSGNWQVSDTATFTPGLGRVVLDATTGPKTIITSSSGADDFYDLKFNGTGGSWQVSDPLTVNKNFTLTNGTIDFNGQTITVTKNMSIEAGGQIDQADDSMNATTLNIGGRLDLLGESTDKLIFRWTSPWTLNVTRNATLNYVSFITSSTNSMIFTVSSGTAIARNTIVAFSDAHLGVSIYAGDGTSTNNGNNPNWLFSGAAPNPAAYIFGGGIIFGGNLRIK